MRDSGRVDTSRGVTCPVSPARCALGPVVITGDIYAAPLTPGALLGHIVDRGTLGDTRTPLTLTLSAGWGRSSSTFTLGLTCHVSRPSAPTRTISSPTQLLFCCTHRQLFIDEEFLV